MRVHQILFAISLILGPTWAYSADTVYWVHPTNSTAGSKDSCTNPSHNTLTAGVAAAAAAAVVSGHTIHVCPGSYSQLTLLNLNNVNHVGLRIVGEGASPSEVSITGNVTPTTIDIFSIARAGITLENMQLNLADNAVVTTAAGTGATLRNLEINTTDNDCIAALGNTLTITNVALNGCLIRGLELIVAGTATITGLTVNNVLDQGIFLQNVTGGTFRDLTVNGTGNDGINLTNVDNATFGVSLLSTNLITNIGNANNEHGVELATNSDNNSFTNFTITNFYDTGLVAGGTGSGNSFTNFVITGGILNVDDCINISSNNTTINGAVLDDCTDMGLIASVTGGTRLNLNNIDISNTGNDGLQIANINSAVNGSGDVSVTDISIANSADLGILLSATRGGVYKDLNIQNSTTFGISMVNADNNTFSLNSLSENLIAGNGIGIKLTTNSDNNQFSNFNISNSGTIGLILTGLSVGNTIRNSDISNNTTVGLQITTDGRSNIIRDNLFIDNGTIGLQITNTNTNTLNSIFDNCFRNSSNVDDAETTVATNKFDDSVSRGNFYGSSPIAGTGFSETCIDNRAEDDDICDSIYAVPGAGPSVDNYPLQKCDAFEPDLIFSKTVLTFSDPINLAVNPKAIPGATVLYTIIATNSTNTRRGMAEDAVITDNLTDEIVTRGSLAWNVNSMSLTAPEVLSGGAPIMTDATDSDEAEFNGTNVTARCGDLNAGQSCTLTFTLEIQ